MIGNKLRLVFRKISLICLSFLIVSCGTTSSEDDSIKSYSRQRVRGSQSYTVTNTGGGHYKVGNPYKIFGTTYYPKEDYSYSEIGTASWYGKDFHAKDTANGEKYNMNSLTAAHRTLPLPSIVKVTNLENGRTVILRVNDRGPYAKNRIIDISKRGAEILGFQTQGTAKVKVEIMAKESQRLKEAILNKDGIKVTRQTPYPKYQHERTQTPIYTNTAKTGERKYIQAGSFSTFVAAKNLQNQLSGFGNVNIYPVEVGGNKFYRVRVGPYNSEAEANRDLKKIINYGVYNSKVVTE